MVIYTYRNYMHEISFRFFERTNYMISEKKEENPAGENQMQAAADAHSDESGQYGEYMVKPLKPALKRRRFI